MSAKLFNYAVILHPSDKEAEDGVPAKILVEPGVVLATDQNAAVIRAARKISEEDIDKLDRIEVVVSPF